MSDNSIQNIKLDAYDAKAVSENDNQQVANELFEEQNEIGMIAEVQEKEEQKAADGLPLERLVVAPNEQSLDQFSANSFDEADLEESPAAQV